MPEETTETTEITTEITGTTAFTETTEGNAGLEGIEGIQASQFILHAPVASAPFVAPGRPRDDAREQAILDAALSLVAEVGFERLTMDAIAARAKASKATIYRRWTSKQELVVDAMHCYVSDSMSEPEDTGDVRGDLVAQVHLLTDSLNGFDGHLILGLAQAALSNPGLCAALEQQAGPDKQRPARIVVERAIERGELPAGADPTLFNEIAPPILIMRMVNGLSIDAEFLEHLVDDILLPALEHPSTSPQPPALDALGALGATPQPHNNDTHPRQNHTPPRHSDTPPLTSTASTPLPLPQAPARSTQP